ncbi:MAG: hypothetical protein IRY95_09830, partial [Clostridia bacterium]|nr:hypothetical protein [Clostridia bacterium]
LAQPDGTLLTDAVRRLWPSPPRDLDDVGVAFRRCGPGEAADALLLLRPGLEPAQVTLTLRRRGLAARLWHPVPALHLSLR